MSSLRASPGFSLLGSDATSALCERYGFYTSFFSAFTSDLMVLLFCWVVFFGELSNILGLSSCLSWSDERVRLSASIRARLEPFSRVSFDLESANFCFFKTFLRSKCAFGS